MRSVTDPAELALPDDYPAFLAWLK
ncbi:hypothetical protein CITRIK5_90004 [Citricoccus sp. K5]|nr:hypothetical protein CITRIK5_90004 [Citricoccus sp. K5]